MNPIPQSLSQELEKVLKNARNERSGEPLGQESQKNYTRTFQAFFDIASKHSRGRKMECLADFRVEDLKNYKAALETGPSKLKPTTIIRRIMEIKGVFKNALAQGIVPANMTKELKVYWPECEEQYRRLHTDELERLLRIDNKRLAKMDVKAKFIYFRDKTMVALHKDAALRADDVVHISLQDILWSQRSAGGYVPLIVWEGKWRPRGWKDTVYLSPGAVALIKRYLEIRSEYLIAKGLTAATILKRKSHEPEGEALFFLQTKGKVIQGGHYDGKVFKPLVKEAGLPIEYTSHYLRHTQISEWVESGLDPKRVQQLARHKTIQMTLKYYHFNEKELLDDLDRRFSAATNQPQHKAQVLPEKSVLLEIMRHALKQAGQNPGGNLPEGSQTILKDQNLQDLFCSVAEACSKLRIGRTQLYKGWIADGHLHSWKLEKRTVFLKSEVEELASYRTSEEASVILGYKEKTPVSVCKLAVDGIIPSIKLGKGYAFRNADLCDYLRDKHSGRLRLQACLREKMPELQMPFPLGRAPEPPAPGISPQISQ